MQDRMGVRVERGHVILGVTGGGGEVRLRRSVVWSVGEDFIHGIRHPEEVEHGESVDRLIRFKRGDLLVVVGKYDGDIDALRERHSQEHPRPRGRPTTGRGLGRGTL
jgi:hypothetical protein